MPRYVALLRGINVGGNTMLKMSDLKLCLERAGLENVVTYINSGNVGLDHAGSEAEVIELIERAIETDLGRVIPVMVRSRAAVENVIAANPFEGEFESHKEMHVLFLKTELAEDKAEQLTNAAQPPERYSIMGREVYCHLPMGVADSLLGRSFVEKKLKVEVTGRNWRTVQKLAVL